MTQFVLLDTNILFRYVTQGEPGCESEHFDALKEFVTDGKVKLFSSEVVELEFQAECKGLEDRLKKEIREIEERMTTAIQGVIGETFSTNKKKPKNPAWNEISDLHPWLQTETSAFSKKLKQWPEDKLKEARLRIENVNALTGLPIVERLAFDQDIMLRTKRRFIAKRFKRHQNESKPEADYNIVDSVARYFETHNSPYRVLFCSANTNDLATEYEHNKFVLHPTIKEDFPDNSGLFVSLADLVTFIKDQKPLEEPPPDKLQNALDREDSARRFFKTDDIQLIKYSLDNNVVELRLEYAAIHSWDNDILFSISSAIRYANDIATALNYKAIRPIAIAHDAQKAILCVNSCLSNHHYFPKTEPVSKLARELIRLRNLCTDLQTKLLVLAVEGSSMG